MAQLSNDALHRVAEIRASYNVASAELGQWLRQLDANAVAASATGTAGDRDVSALAAELANAQEVRLDCTHCKGALMQLTVAAWRGAVLD